MEAQSMDRNCCVSSTFGQSITIFHGGPSIVGGSVDKAYIVDAAGMIKDLATWQNFLAICCGLECLGTLPFAKFGYEKDSYTMKQVSGGCCGQKRYNMIKDGADGFRDGTKLAETFKTKKGRMFKIRIPVEVEDKPNVFKMQDQYSVNTKAQCCKGEGTMGNCKDGITKFLPIMKTTLPIKNGENVEVGQIAVIQPLIPTGCCCAAGGCTISSKIEMNSDKCDMDDDEKARLALLLLSINNHTTMGPMGFTGCPALVFGLAFRMLGWPFSVQYAGGKKEYLPLGAAFAEGIAETGDLVPRMKAKFSGKNPMN